MPKAKIPAWQITAAGAALLALTWLLSVARGQVVVGPQNTTAAFYSYNATGAVSAIVTPANIGSSHPVGNLMSGFVRDANGSTNLWILGSEANGSAGTPDQYVLEVDGNLTLLGQAVVKNVDPALPYDIGAIDAQDLDVGGAGDKRVTLDRFRAADSTGGDSGQRYILTVGGGVFQNALFLSQYATAIIGDKGYPFELPQFPSGIGLEVYGSALVDGPLSTITVNSQPNPFFGNPSTFSSSYLPDTNHIYVSGSISNASSGVYGFNLGMTITWRTAVGSLGAFYTNSGANGLWGCGIDASGNLGNFIYMSSTNDLLSFAPTTGWFNSNTNFFPANSSSWFWNSSSAQTMVGPTSFCFGTNGYSTNVALVVNGSGINVTNVPAFVPNLITGGGYTNRNSFIVRAYAIGAVSTVMYQSVIGGTNTPVLTNSSSPFEYVLPSGWAIVSASGLSGQVIFTP